MRAGSQEISPTLLQSILIKQTNKQKQQRIDNCCLECRSSENIRNICTPFESVGFNTTNPISSQFFLNFYLTYIRKIKWHLKRMMKWKMWQLEKLRHSLKEIATFSTQDITIIIPSLYKYKFWKTEFASEKWMMKGF